jgi:hypothetical protein
VCCRCDSCRPLASLATANIAYQPAPEVLDTLHDHTPNEESDTRSYALSVLPHPLGFHAPSGGCHYILPMVGDTNIIPSSHQTQPKDHARISLTTSATMVPALIFLCPRHYSLTLTNVPPSHPHRIPTTTRYPIHHFASPTTHAFPHSHLNRGRRPFCPKHPVFTQVNNPRNKYRHYFRRYIL